MNSLRALLLIAAVMPGLGHAQQPPAPRVVVVEATASMAARLDSAPKLAHVKAALADVLTQPRLSLIAFGRRAAKGCDDVEPIAGTDALKALRTGRGKAAAAAGLEAARDALDGAASGEALLVVDGLPDCAAVCPPEDSAGIRFSVLVIAPRGRGAATTLRGLRCLADATRGAAIVAHDKAAVQRAVMAFARGGADAMTASAADSDIAAAPAPPVPDAAPRLPGLFPAPLPAVPNVRLVARLGDRAISEGLGWRIFIAGADRAGAPVWSGGGNAPEVLLPPGRYTAFATLAGLLAEAEFEATGTMREVNVVFLAGTVQPGARLSDTGGALDGAFFRIRRGGAEAAEPDLVRTSRTDRAVPTPAGALDVIADLGAAQGRTALALSAGQSAIAMVTLQAGTVQPVVSFAGDTEPLPDALMLVLDSTGAEVARSALPRPRLVLPAGRYRLVARAGFAESTREITLAAGETIAPRMVIDGGRVLLSDMPAEAGPVSARFTPAAGGTPIVATGAGRMLVLPSGSYKLALQWGFENARSERELRVPGGGSVSVPLDVPGAVVSFRLIRGAGAGAAAQRNARWRIVDRSGTEVARLSPGEDAAVLASGEYTAEAEAGGLTHRQDFTVELAARDVEILAKP